MEMHPLFYRLLSACTALASQEDEVVEKVEKKKKKKKAESEKSR